MSATTTHPPDVQTTGAGVTIVLPQKDASGLHTFLKDHGIASTLIFQSWTEPATLEVWPGTDEATVRRAVEEWARQVP